jgi:hypothetical protein
MDSPLQYDSAGHNDKNIACEGIRGGENAKSALPKDKRRESVIRQGAERDERPR